MKIKYTFFAPDGSFVDAVVSAEAFDSGDKATNKALSAGQKYAFLQVFCIPTEEPKDSEIDDHEVKAVIPKKEEPKPKDVEKKKPEFFDDTEKRNKALAVIHGAKDKKTLDKVKTTADEYYSDGHISEDTFKEIETEITKKLFELQPMGEK
jgi:hypothetical protein